jgi:deoxyribonuclease I
MSFTVRGLALTVIRCYIVLILASPSLIFAQNTTIDSFNKAKKFMEQVFAGHETTFYYGCRYTGNEVDLASCGYQAKKDLDHAKR